VCPVPKYKSIGVTIVRQVHVEVIEITMALIFKERISPGYPGPLCKPAPTHMIFSVREPCVTVGILLKPVDAVDYPRTVVPQTRRDGQKTEAMKDAKFNAVPRPERPTKCVEKITIPMVLV